MKSLKIMNYMEKDFDKWAILKWKLESKKTNVLCKEWDIWWSSIWVNIWNESCWKGEEFRRPVLIIKKLSSTNFIVVPLSTQSKTWTWFASYSLHWVNYTALLYQIRMIHVNRFTKREAQMSLSDFEKIKKRLNNLLNL